MSMIHVLLEEKLYDENFVRDWTNGSFLVRQDNHQLLTARDLSHSGDSEKDRSPPLRFCSPVSAPAGVIAYSVSQRTREIGIRLALGASAQQVQRLMAQSGLKMAVAGIASGVPAALASTRALEGIRSVNPTPLIPRSLRWSR